MNDVVEFLNYAVFNNIKVPFFIFTAVFAILTVLTIIFVAYELKKHKNDIK